MGSDDNQKYEIHMAEQKLINEKLTTAIEGISNTMSTMADDMKGVNTSMHKQELTLEKISNMEDKIEDNNKRVHKRIDGIEKTYKDDITEIKLKQEKEIDTVKSDMKEEIRELKEEHIEPIKKSLDYAWKTLFGKLLVLVGVLITIIYNVGLK